MLPNNEYHLYRYAKIAPVNRLKETELIVKDLAELTTETRSPYLELDTMSIPEVLAAINAEDRQVPVAVGQEIGAITRAVELIVARLQAGGRLFYVGAGTSGRLGVLDASECPPTFGVEPDLVQAIIAGGDVALRFSVEGVEDDAAAGGKDLADRGCSQVDAVVAIAASGRTPYCLGALQHAAAVGAATIALVCNRNTPMEKLATVTIAPIVGPEVLAGSTRMKAGTAQKMVLNMLTTTVMVRMGKVYSNLMVGMSPANTKLVERAVRMVAATADVPVAKAREALASCNWDAKEAIVTLLCNCPPQRARELLQAADGYIRKAVELAQQR